MSTDNVFWRSIDVDSVDKMLEMSMFWSIFVVFDKLLEINREIYELFEVSIDLGKLW